MAKYLDGPGLQHVFGILKGLLHVHSIPNSAFDTTTVPNVTSVGSAPTLGTQFTIPNISVTNKTVPNISVAAATTDTVKGVNVFTPNTPTAVTKKTVVTTHTPMSAVPSSTNPATLVITKDSSSSGDSVSVTNGTAASLTTVNKTFTTDATKATEGTAISIGSASAGTAFKVPNVTSVGSAPTLGTAKTVISGVKSTAKTGQAHIDDAS